MSVLRIFLAVFSFLWVAVAQGQEKKAAPLPDQERIKWEVQFAEPTEFFKVVDRTIDPKAGALTWHIEAKADFWFIPGLASAQFFGAAGKLFETELSVTPWHLKKGQTAKISLKIPDKMELKKVEKVIVVAHGDDDKHFVPFGQKTPREPNTLTAQEKADGWELLYDGTSTAGWKVEGEATSKDGILRLGGLKPASLITTRKFHPTEVEVSFECRRIKGKVFEVSYPVAGRFPFREDQESWFDGKLKFPEAGWKRITLATKVTIDKKKGKNEASLAYSAVSGNADSFTIEADLHWIIGGKKIDITSYTSSVGIFFRNEKGAVTNGSTFAGLATLSLEAVGVMVREDWVARPLEFTTPAESVVELRSVRIRSKPAEK